MRDKFHDSFDNYSLKDFISGVNYENIHYANFSITISPQYFVL
jgi:hypothetical protein